MPFTVRPCQPGIPLAFLLLYKPRLLIRPELRVAFLLQQQLIYEVVDRRH